MTHGVSVGAGVERTSGLRKASIIAQFRNMPSQFARVLAAMAVVLALTGILVAVAAWLQSRDDEPAASRTPTATAIATPTAGTTTPTPTRTPSPSPTATRAAATATALATAGAPAGYERSCAAGYPWGQQVRAPFVCIEEPQSGAMVARGTVLTVRGYAGGSFENNVVVELHDVQGAVRVRQALAYVAPDIGMPGQWSIRVAIPFDMPVGSARAVAHFDSPRDGGVVALASIELRVQ